jgi:Domain of unknown function (DUF6458)
VGIGGSIFLIVVGAIFAFALDVNLGWLDINVVGWVLMLAGVFGLILTLYWMRGRRRTAVRPAAPTAPTAPPAAYVREDRVVAPREDRVVEEYREVRREPY